MAESFDQQLSMRLASEIVIAYLAQRALEPEQLPELLRAVRAALESDAVGADQPVQAAARSTTSGRTGSAAAPAVPVEESITPDYLISLEDGKPYRSLRRHLMARYGLTPDAYRQKWNLPSDYPMVAPNYARDRSEVAKRIGLGRTAKAKPRSRFSADPSI
ncbi:MAG: MucR family transcriptional regulator [Phenylobacterium sp.]|uniref:MucR family transcriptional regulator n=1 Tax=Phenylobacterium sp. TaxID=1871053 RepID=UPI00356680A1